MRNTLIHNFTRKRFSFSLAIIASVLLGLNTIIFAAGNTYISVQAGTGEVSVTKSNYIDPGDDTPYTVPTRTTSMAYRIAGGYLYQITPSFSIGPELSYGVAPDTKSSYDGKEIFKTSLVSADLVANATYQFKEQWYIISKLGISYATVKPRPLTSDPDDTFDYKNATEVLPTFSLGVGIRINDKITMDIMFNHVFGVNDAYGYALYHDGTVRVPSVTTYMLGFNYAF